MRMFSENEKKFIRALIKGSEIDPHSNFPINVLDPLFSASKMRFDAFNQISQNSQGVSSQVIPTLTFQAVNTNSINLKFIQDVKQRLYELALLLEYLTNEGLLYKVKNYNHTNIYSYDACGPIPAATPVVVPLEQCISDFLVSCINEPIYVGETLKDLSKNNFASVEERALIEAKQQTANSLKSLKISNIALWVAIVTLVVTSISSCSSEIKKYLPSKEWNAYGRLNAPQKSIVVKVNDIVLKAKVYRNSLVISKEITVLRNRMDKFR